MRSRRHRSLCWAAAALVWSVSAPAGAQAPGAPSAPPGEAAAPSARDLYDAAQRLFDKGAYAEAVVAFRQAYNASNSPNARIMIAQCLIGLGKNAEAYEEMAATHAEAAKRAETEAKYVPTRDAAATQLALLEPKVGKVVVEVPAGLAAAVSLNGSRLAAEKLGAAVAVDPGVVIVSAALPDGRTAHVERQVKAGATEKVALAFPDASAKPPPSGSGSPGGDKPPPGDAANQGFFSGRVRIGGVAVAGLGVVGMAVFGITGAMATGDFNKLETECGTSRCTDPKYAGVVDQGKTLSAVSTASVIVGGAALAAGGLMIVFGGPSAPAPASTGSGKGGGARAQRPAQGPFSSTALTVSPAVGGLRCAVTF
jgi:hypothetical protein